MPYTSMPTKPTTNASWVAWGDAVDTNIRQTLTDVPAVKTEAATNTAAVAAQAAQIAALQAQKANTASLSTVAFSGVIGDTTGVLPVERAAAGSIIYTTGSARPTARTDVTCAFLGADPANPGANDLRLDANGVLSRVGSGGSSAATTTTFTAANGSAWPAPWVTAKMPTGGAANIQSNEGRIVTAAVVGNYDSVDATAVRHQNQAADLDVTFTVRRVTSGVDPRFILRSDRDDLDPENGVVVPLSGSTLKIVTVTGYVYADAATSATTWATGTSYRVRVQAAGVTVRAKKWAVGDVEPAAWAVTASVARTSSGHWGWWVSPGQTAAAYTAAFDDVTIAGGTPSAVQSVMLTQATTRPTTDPSVKVVFYTAAPPVAAMLAGDVWEPTG